MTVPVLEHTSAVEQVRAPNDRPAVDEASHLRHLLEKQPSCLLRIGRDGVLLACNDASLNLLGKTTLTEVLDRPFAAHLTPDDTKAWCEFSEWVWENGAGSIECNLATSDNSPRTILLQAVALRDHPDTVESVLVSVHDATPLHRIETLLQDDDTRERLVEAQARLDEAIAAQAALTGQLDQALAQRDAEREQSARQAAEIARLEELSEQHQAALRGRDDEARQRIADLERQLSAATLEQTRLTTLLDETRRERDAVETTYRAAEAARHVANDKVEQLLAEARSAAAARVETAETARAEIEQRIAQEYEQRMSERDRHEREAIADLEARHALVLSDHTRIQDQLERAEAERERLVAARAADRMDAERLIGEVALKKNAIDKALADQRVELQEWRNVAAELEPLAAVGRLAAPLSDELRRFLGKLNDRAAFLLSLSHVDASYRPEIEALRAEALKALSLARQLSPPMAPRVGD